ncbi:phage tail protein [Wolbachia endosymbiont of Diaphorina citri]|uniref:phage tail protein n=1 Tax=Wolbachia endosymbiont of Diaphorina citri TaxID=116598 RepID=UPI00155E2161|nr:phage tail protein [Wolbachia endosymbiont of Diaphorina citri]QJT94831.1 phage tail protein [Wolbachia endosymbiont of Diaphorina citri]QJT96144.1 phage tail protein [Wolbachia endosymbiont of Diaphorina citri]QJT97512.1 phage tail protein [Wolbachia endosymbiont of Diaphorina citri]QLK11996.1 phage tail protein [Wolbachia endosymbiont of Diaphorina citri]
MSIHIEVEVIESVNAKRRKVELATVKALNKTALWLKAQAAKEISEEKKIKLTVMRKRLLIFKAKAGRLEVLIRANLYDVRASSIGSMRETKRGTKTGNHEFIGAFTATMPRGYKGAFKREGRAALPIKEVKLPLEPEASKVIRDLVNYEVEKVFEKFFERDITENV